MKCSSCGADNQSWARVCTKCGKALGSTRNISHVAASHAEPEAVDSKSVSTKMKLDYLHGVGDPTQRRLDGLQSLLAHFRKPQMDLDLLMQEAANLISKNLMIDNASIGLRDPKDGLYKYRALAGFREDAVEAHRKIVYRKEQFLNDPEYVGTEISKQSKLYLTEDNALTDSEQRAFNRPALLSQRRRSADDSIEGDYIDVKILGPGDDLLGWIEVSGTRTMKLPDTTAIRWIETIASIIGAAVITHSARR